MTTRTLAAALALIAAMPTAAETTVITPSRTQIVIMPVACPDKALCNVFHARYVTHDGVVEFSRDIPSAWMASSVSIEVRTGKGTVKVWSDR